ncbi:YciI family protein [Hyphomicrobium album]|nr:YciI family protein [Hyphomicrobium album]
MKVLGMLRADPSSEAGQPPTKDQMERMGAFLEEVTNAGVILSGDGLRPTKYGKRVSLKDGKFSVVDGPFTESKELVASYALLQVDSMEEAEKWTRRFLEVFGQGQCELRPIIEASDFPSDVFTAEEQAREAKTRAQMEKNARHR